MPVSSSRDFFPRASSFFLSALSTLRRSNVANLWNVDLGSGILKVRYLKTKETDKRYISFFFSFLPVQPALNKLV